MEANIILITPEIAAEYLKKNRKNRKISERHVKKLAREMEQDKWVLNGEPIQFNLEGELINGQHRLSAIILSEKSVPILVITDIEDPNAFATIDQNSLSRGAHTVLQMKGVQNANQMTSISKKLWHWDNTTDKPNFSFNVKSYKDILSGDVVDFYEKNEPEILFVYETMKDARIVKTCGSRSALIAALVICYKANSYSALGFMSKFASGIGLEENSPILLLRDKLSYGLPKEGGRLRDLEVMALTIKAFNNYSEGKRRKILRWNATEKFPSPIHGFLAC